MRIERDGDGRVVFADYANGGSDPDINLRCIVIDEAERHHDMSDVFEARAGSKGYVRLYIRDSAGLYLTTIGADGAILPAAATLSPCHVVIEDVVAV